MIFLRVIIYVVIFFITFIHFFPTQKVVDYGVDNYVKIYDIDLSSSINNNLLTYEGKNSILFYKSKKIADINSVKITPFIGINKVEINDIKLKGIVAGLIPTKIESLTATYSIINPEEILLNGKGEFGKFDGKFNILNSRLSIELTPSLLMLKKFSFPLSYLKKNGKKYIYEYTL